MMGAPEVLQLNSNLMQAIGAKKVGPQLFVRQVRPQRLFRRVEPVPGKVRIHLLFRKNTP